jgi:hypothetical protein
MMKKLFLGIGLVCGATGIYYSIKTNNNNINGNSSLLPSELPPLYKKIKNIKSKLDTLIKSQDHKEYLLALQEYQSILLRAQNIISQHPFEIFSKPHNILSIIDHILFNSLLCTEQLNTEEIIKHTNSDNVIFKDIKDSIDLSLRNVNNAFCSKDISYIKGYLEEYSTVLKNTLEAIKAISEPLESEKPWDLLDVLNYII